MITLRRPGFARALMRGSNGLGESYAEGVWECDDPVALIRLAARNADQIDAVRRRWQPLLAPFGRRSVNTRGRSRRQIAAHYDLGNRLFELFLDESMTYSCAVFEDEQADLGEAQRPSCARSASSWSWDPTITCSRSGPAGARWRCTRRRTTAAA